MLNTDGSILHTGGPREPDRDSVDEAASSPGSKSAAHARTVASTVSAIGAELDDGRRFGTDAHQHGDDLAAGAQRPARRSPVGSIWLSGAERDVHGDTVERFARGVPVGERQLDVAVPPDLGKVGEPDARPVFAIGKELVGEVEEPTVALALRLPPSVEPAGVSDVGIDDGRRRRRRASASSTSSDAADASRHLAPTAVEELLVPGARTSGGVVPLPLDQGLR